MAKNQQINTQKSVQTQKNGASSEVNNVQKPKSLRFGLDFAVNYKMMSDESVALLQNLASQSDEGMVKSRFGDDFEKLCFSKHEISMVAKILKKIEALKIIRLECENLKNFDEISMAWEFLAKESLNYYESLLKENLNHMRNALKSEFHFGHHLQTPKKSQLIDEVARLKAELAALKQEKSAKKA